MSLKNLAGIFSKWLASVFIPQYQLSLDRTIEDDDSKVVSYIFKLYGSHEFVHFTYDDICKNHNVLNAINPFDLKQIHIAEYQRAIDKAAYKVVSYLRNAEYIVEYCGKTEKHSGSYIGQNLNLFKSINPTDLWKIAYAEGFIRGKKLADDIYAGNGIKFEFIQKCNPSQNNVGNVVNFKDYTIQ